MTDIPHFLQRKRTKSTFLSQAIGYLILSVLVYLAFMVILFEMDSKKAEAKEMTYTAVLDGQNVISKETFCGS